MKDHQKIMEGVENMVSQTLELKHKQIEKETELKILLRMKMAGIPKHAIATVAKSENISEEEINKIFDNQE